MIAPGTLGPQHRGQDDARIVCWLTCVEMGEGVGEAELPDHKRVAELQVLHTSFQSRSIVARSGRLVGVEVPLVHPGCDQRVTLSDCVGVRKASAERFPSPV